MVLSSRAQSYTHEHVGVCRVSKQKGGISRDYHGTHVVLLSLLFNFSAVKSSS